MLEKLIQKVKDNWPYYIYNVDYNTSLDENPDALEGIIQWDTYNDSIWDYFDTSESIDCIISDIFTPEERDLIKKNCWLSYIEDVIWGLDSSHPIQDLCKNTKETTVLVDLGFYIDYDDSRQERHKQIREFMRKLKIPLIDNPNKPWKKMYNNKIIDSIDSILIETYTWWQIYAIIQADPWDFYHSADKNIEVEISDILIYDSYQWSWDFGSISSEIPIQIVSREDLILSSNMWWYTIRECFGTDDLGNSNSYSFTNDDVTILGESAIKNKKLKEERATQEKRYRKTWCWWFSANIDLHKTHYQNEPMSCGHKCSICWRLWLD